VVVVVTDVLGPVKLGPVVAHQLASPTRRPAIRAPGKRGTAGEQASEPVVDAQVRFGCHVAEVMRDHAAADRHVAATDTARPSDGSPPTKRAVATPPFCGT
jgi:hypothetical protein